MVKMKGSNKEDLIYIFRQLFAKGKISKEEFDKCVRLSFREGADEENSHILPSQYRRRDSN